MSSPGPSVSKTPKRSLRERVLDAAERVVTRDGAAHLTLDAVVAEAGVSKGGMLYHFRNKDALLKGLLARTLDRHMARAAETLALFPEDDPYRTGRAHLLASIDTEPVQRDLGLALIAAAAHNPDMMEPGRAAVAESMAALRALEDELPTARLLWFAMHGMHFLDILGISPLTQDDKAGLRDQAHRILSQTGDSR